jgi:hypothetical protein
MLVLSHRVVEMNALPTSLSQIRQLVDRRLAITQKGLAEARRHLTDGQPAAAEIVLEKIDEDLHLLRCRIGREVEKIAPRSGDLHGCAN